MTPHQKLFLIGLLGAMAVEVGRWHELLGKILRSQLKRNPDPFPKLKAPWYLWCVYACASIFLSLLGGLLAYLYEPQSLIGAFQIGLSTPIIIAPVMRRIQFLK